MSWQYYKHALLSNNIPSQEEDASTLQDKKFWKKWEGKVFFARWTTDFDCGYETNWWYVLKDDAYDIQSLKAKRRYEITKGRKNFTVKEICPADHLEALYKVQVAAFSVYPAKYRPTVDKEEFAQTCKGWTGTCLGAFSKTEDGGEGTLCGYAYLTRDRECIYYSVQKTISEYERQGINAALTDGVLTFYKDALLEGAYVCDGERSINHETAFQDYLEKYFGFRKAYCKLNVRYRRGIGLIIALCYPFRGILKKLDKIGFIHLLNGVMKMEELRRAQKKALKKKSEKEKENE